MDKPGNFILLFSFLCLRILILFCQTEKAHDHAKEVLEGLDQKLSRVEYEELSSQVYDYEEEKNLHIGNRDMIDMERENLQVQAEQTEKKLHILQCARQQDSVSEEKGELDLLREKIAVARQQGADLEPERKALGIILVFQTGIGFNPAFQFSFFSKAVWRIRKRL